MNRLPGSSGATQPHSQVWAGYGPLALCTPIPRALPKHGACRRALGQPCTLKGSLGSHHPAGPFLPPTLAHMRCAGRTGGAVGRLGTEVAHLRADCRTEGKKASFLAKSMGG